MPSLNLNIRLAAGPLVLLAMLASAGAQAANAEPMQIEDQHILAKVARLRAQQQTITADIAPSQSVMNSACGGMDIGNMNNAGRPMGGPSELTVVVSGDIINLAKCR